MEYANIHPDNVYMIPTNSFARFTTNVDFYSKESVAGKTISTGGWTCITPLTSQRLGALGITRIPDDFIKDEVYIINWKSASIDYITDSLSEVMGKNVKYEIVDSIETSEGLASVFQLIME